MSNIVVGMKKKTNVDKSVSLKGSKSSKLPQSNGVPIPFSLLSKSAEIKLDDEYGLSEFSQRLQSFKGELLDYYKFKGTCQSAGKFYWRLKNDGVDEEKVSDQDEKNGKNENSPKFESVMKTPLHRPSTKQPLSAAMKARLTRLKGRGRGISGSIESAPLKRQKIDEASASGKEKAVEKEKEKKEEKSEKKEGEKKEEEQETDNNEVVNVLSEVDWTQVEMIVNGNRTTKDNDSQKERIKILSAEIQKKLKEVADCRIARLSQNTKGEASQSKIEDEFSLNELAEKWISASQDILRELKEHFQGLHSDQQVTIATLMQSWEMDPILFGYKEEADDFE